MRCDCRWCSHQNSGLRNLVELAKKGASGTGGGTAGSSSGSAAEADGTGESETAAAAAANTRRPAVASAKQAEKAKEWRRQQGASKVLYKHYQEGKPLPAWEKVRLCFYKRCVEFMRECMLQLYMHRCALDLISMHGSRQHKQFPTVIVWLPQCSSASLSLPLQILGPSYHMPHQQLRVALARDLVDKARDTAPPADNQKGARHSSKVCGSLQHFVFRAGAVTTESLSQQPQLATPFMKRNSHQICASLGVLMAP